MKKYGKIQTDGRIMLMPNPYRVVIANPTDAQKEMIAAVDDWLEMVYTDEPSYDPDTQYVIDYWTEEDGKAVQHWEVHDYPTEGESEEVYDS